MLLALDFTAQGRKPSTAQIISAWKKAGSPVYFTVEYGETFAEFDRISDFSQPPRWADGGNGCSGVKRGAVVEALIKASTQRQKQAEDRKTNW